MVSSNHVFISQLFRDDVVECVSVGLNCIQPCNYGFLSFLKKNEYRYNFVALCLARDKLYLQPEFLNATNTVSER